MNSSSSRTFSVSEHVAATRTALQFLTIFPVGSLGLQDKKVTGLSLLYYPAVGLLVGFALAVFAWLAQSVLSIYSLELLLLAALALTVWVGLTGALHLDGLADCADAWLGGMGSSQRTLAIMKDPTSGPIAVTVLVLLLLVKFVTLAALLAKASLWLLLVAPFVARLAVLALLLTTPYIRPQGLGEVLSQHFPRQEAKLVLAVAVVAYLLLDFTRALPILLVSVAVLLGLRAMMLSRLRGCTGDTMGATVEILEAVCLVVLVVVL